MTAIIKNFFATPNSADMDNEASINSLTRTSRGFIYRLLAIDFVLCCLIVWFIPYTEIDWIAYMQEVKGFLDGEMDYTKLKGDTGPLVYPAGFLYLYSALYYITDYGKNIFLAQCLFIFVYLATSYFVMEIFRMARLPQTLCVLLLFSKRIHSIFMLRCFNDCFAMLFAYIAIFYFMRQRWSLGCTWFSLAVSIKMNVLLMAPGLFCVMVKKFPIPQWIGLLSICAFIQLALGAPFLMTYPVQYLSKAFELSRVFTYTWTVNFRFLPEEIFVSKPLGHALLACTILSWITLAVRRWVKRSYHANRPENIAATMFESSFTGILFARTLHYQFYSWFFHQLPFLLYYSCYHEGPALTHIWKLVVMGGIEYAFNKFPSTDLSSGILVACLLIIEIFALFICNDPPASEKSRHTSVENFNVTTNNNNAPRSSSDVNKNNNNNSKKKK